MKVVDANVLLYAVNGDTEHHDVSHRWLDRALNGADTVGLSWIALLAFLRISTKPGLFPRPLTPGQAMAQVTAWLDAPGASVVHPSTQHASTLERLLAQVGTGGNLVNDAHLAAIAMDNRSDIVSFDADFGRFHGLRWHRPDDLL